MCVMQVAAAIPWGLTATPTPTTPPPPLLAPGANNITGVDSGSHQR